MNKTIVIVAALSLSTFAYSQSALPDFPFVFAQGEADIKLPPDIAHISFTVLAYEADPEKARLVVRERTGQILDFISFLKIKQEDVVAYDISKRAVRKRQDYRELEILGYDVSRQIRVTLRNVQLYEVFMKNLLSAANIESVKPGFDRTDREKVESDLLTDAAHNAKQQAEHMAKGFGAKLGTVYAITQAGGFYNLVTQFTVGMGGRSAGGGAGAGGGARGRDEALFVPSTISFRKTVSAIYKIIPGE